MKSNLKRTARLVIVAFAVGLALSACGKGCGSQSSAKSESLQLIPVDSNVLIGINWKKVQASPLGAKIKEEMSRSGAPADIEPLLRDVDPVLIGLNVTPASRDPQSAVIVMGGKIDTAAMLKQMNDQEAKTGSTLKEEDYQGVKVYTSAAKPDFSVAFLDGQTLMGMSGSVKKAIDLSKGQGDSIKKNKAVMDVADGLDKGKMLWAVGLIPPGAIPAGNAANGGNPLSSLSSAKSVDLTLDYNENLALDLGIAAATKEDAQQMMTTANSYKTVLGGTLASKSPEMGKVLSGLSIDAKENKLLVALKLDQATVEELTKAKEKAPATPSTP
jgi:hypothetical protein